MTRKILPLALGLLILVPPSPAGEAGSSSPQPATPPAQAAPAGEAGSSDLPPETPPAQAAPAREGGSPDLQPATHPPPSAPAGEAGSSKLPPGALRVGQARAREAGLVVSRFLLGAYRKTLLIEDQIEAACDRNGVPLSLARAVCMYESGGDGSLVSSAGARGYFQVMPATQRLLGIRSNIEAGVRYLADMRALFGTDERALAAYNAGPGRVRRGHRLPVETQQYVAGILRLLEILRRDEVSLRRDAEAVRLYPVRAGESWLDVSLRTGVSILELRLYNPYLARRSLREGHLVAHPAAPVTPASDLVRWSETDRGWLYTTLPGDLYHHLAFVFDVPLDRLRADNGLAIVDVLESGRVLLLRPGEETPSPTLAVEPAETLAALARRANADPWDLVRENGLWDQQPQPGHVLRTGRAPSASSAGGRAAPATPRHHRVRPGETLYRLARRYGTTIEAIQRINGLAGSRLFIGQRLRIPAGP